MTPVESLVKKLAEVQNLLVALPDDAFFERAELVRRREDLQAEAEMYSAGVDRERSTEDLRLELAQLRAVEPNSDTERRRRGARISHIEDVLGERRIRTD